MCFKRKHKKLNYKIKNTTEKLLADNCTVVSEWLNPNSPN